MNKIYFTSDLHFCHDKDFIYEPRGFKSVDEMNEAIVKNFKEIIDDNDKLYILGDCFLCNDEKGIELVKSLPGEKYIIWGNHDTTNRQKILEQAGFNCLGYANTLKYKGYHFYLSHYPTITSNYDADKPLKRRVINLCAHSHTTNKFFDMDKGLCYHVELDAHENKPVLIDDIIKEIEEILH